MKTRTWIFRVLVGAVLLGGGLYASRYFSAPSCASVKAQVHEWGTAAPWIFVGVTTLGSLLIVPRVLILLVGGLAFGFWWGLLWVMVSSMLSATLAFYFGRYAGRDLVAWMLRRSDKFRQLIENVEKVGFNLVVLLRLLHVVPYTPLNLAMGILPFRFSEYFFGSLVGLLPGTLPFVYFGTTLGCALIDDKAEIPHRTWIFLGISFTALAVLSALPIVLNPAFKKKQATPT